MPVHNSEIARIFNKIAGLLSIQGANQFRIRAYRNAARTVAGISKNVAEMLADKYGSIEQLQKIDRGDLMETPEIGPEIAESVYRFFNRDENLKTIDRLKKAGVRPRKKKSRANRSLKGEKFVFTGNLDNYTRQEAEDLVSSLGGRTTSGVSGATDYLVAGDNPGKKFSEARKRKIRILDEKEFEGLVRRKQHA